MSQRRCKHAPSLEYANIASILVHRDFKESTGYLKFDSNEALLPVEDLSAAFTDFPPEKHLHVVVKLPPVGKWCIAFRIHICQLLRILLAVDGDLVLNCYVLSKSQNDYDRRIFLVKLASMDTVGDLKNCHQIREKPHVL